MPIAAVKPVISVFVNYSIHPPAWKIAECIQNALSTNFAEYDLELRTGLQPTRIPSPVYGACFSLNRAVVALSQNVRARYGVSIVPLYPNSAKLNTSEPDGIFMSVRNCWYKEYIFFGTEQSNPDMADLLGQAALEALSERTHFQIECPDFEHKRMALLSAAMSQSIAFLFGRKPDGLVH